MNKLELEFFQRELEKVCRIDLTEGQVINFLEASKDMNTKPEEAIKLLKGMSKTEIMRFVGTK